MGIARILKKRRRLAEIGNRYGYRLWLRTGREGAGSPWIEGRKAVIRRAKAVKKAARKRKAQRQKN